MLFLLLFALQKQTVLHAPYRRVQFVMLCVCAYLSARALIFFIFFIFSFLHLLPHRGFCLIAEGCCSMLSVFILV